MLKITKIIEGGIDLSTREELPRSMVISNGVREVTVALTDHEMENVVQLYIEGLNQEVEGHARQVVHHIEDTIPAPREVVHATVTMAPKVVADHINLTLKKKDFESDYEDPPPVANPNVVTDDENGFQPGEEYDDSGTGAASL